MQGAEAIERSPFMDVREVAEVLQRSEPRVYQLIAARQIPATRVGRRIVIPRAAFDAWVEEQNLRALAAVAR